MMMTQKRETLHDTCRKTTGTGKQRIKEERAAKEAEEAAAAQLETSEEE